MTHPAQLTDEDLLQQCHFGRGRSSGPGGQHRNKVETLVELTHEPTGVSAKAGERRSQIENKRVALRRLRLSLAVEHRAPVPVPPLMEEVSSELWRSRRQKSAAGGRIVCNPEHRDYPALLAEALDVIADSGWEMRKAALRLGVTASQLLKLIKDHPPALDKLNTERTSHGKRPLR